MAQNCGAHDRITTPNTGAAVGDESYIASEMKDDISSNIAIGSFSLTLKTVPVIDDVDRNTVTFTLSEQTSGEEWDIIRKLDDFFNHRSQCDNKYRFGAGSLTWTHCRYCKRMAHISAFFRLPEKISYRSKLVSAVIPADDENGTASDEVRAQILLVYIQAILEAQNESYQQPRNSFIRCRICAEAFSWTSSLLDLPGCIHRYVSCGCQVENISPTALLNLATEPSFFALSTKKRSSRFTPPLALKSISFSDSGKVRMTLERYISSVLSKEWTVEHNYSGIRDIREFVKNDWSDCNVKKYCCVFCQRMLSAFSVPLPMPLLASRHQRLSSLTGYISGLIVALITQFQEHNTTTCLGCYRMHRNIAALLGISGCIHTLSSTCAICPAVDQQAIKDIDTLMRAIEGRAKLTQKPLPALAAS